MIVKSLATKLTLVGINAIRFAVKYVHNPNAKKWFKSLKNAVISSRDFVPTKMSY